MRPEPGTVLHFSEDPGITRFDPHVARTARERRAYVWAVDAARAPDYWFRAHVRGHWPGSSPARPTPTGCASLGPSATRVHLIEYGWLTALQTVRLYAYRFDAADFTPYDGGGVPHAQVADHPVVPLGPAEPVGDLLALHDDAGIELRLASSIRPWWGAVITSTVGFSGIRLGNAAD